VQIHLCNQSHLIIASDIRETLVYLMTAIEGTYPVAAQREWLGGGGVTTALAK
jgi:hypothetical protein